MYRSFRPGAATDALMTEASEIDNSRRMGDVSGELSYGAGTESQFVGRRVFDRRVETDRRGDNGDTLVLSGDIGGAI